MRTRLGSGQARAGGDGQSATIGIGCGRSGPMSTEDAVTLLEDFWKEVDQVLEEGGSIP